MPAAADSAADRSPSPIVYRVAVPEPNSHALQVRMDVPALPARAAATIVFPAWAPGSYLVRDFVRHVYDLRVVDARGRVLPARRLDKQRWEITSGGRPFRVTYRVFAFEASVRTSFVDDSHAYWNGSSVFFFVDGEIARPCHLLVAPPAGRRWRVDTALPPLGARPNQFRATDFDELVDSPFEIGTHALLRFRAGGANFALALYGRTNADPRRLLDILRRVVTTTVRIFGGGYPFKRYLFIVHGLPVHTGGLEHKASVTMDIAGLSFEDETGYQRFADLAAHEFFHVWNVKRIRDRVLGPFDYTGENYTRLLWFHEGFTDYLANVIIQRAGILSEALFWKWIAEDFPRYANRPGRNVTPLDELSFEAWIKLYKPAENHVNDTVSYYEKGLWAGLVLDLKLRVRSGGARGLPDVFRRLWDRFGARDRPIDEADVRAATAAVAGAPMDDFFARYIHGLDELPVLPLLRKAGLIARERAEWEPDDPGAGGRDRLKEQRLRAWSGIALHPDRTLIRTVAPGSPADRAGLTFNDEVVAVGGDRVNAATFAKRIADHRPGQACAITFFRRDVLQEATLTLSENPERKLVVKPDPKAVKTALAIRRGWLGL